MEKVSSANKRDAKSFCIIEIESNWKIDGENP